MPQNNSQKKRGRPVTTSRGHSRGTSINVRMSPDELATLDKWRGEHVSRPEIIRRLVYAFTHPRHRAK